MTIKQKCFPDQSAFSSNLDQPMWKKKGLKIEVALLSALWKPDPDL